MNLLFVYSSCKCLNLKKQSHTKITIKWQARRDDDDRRESVCGKQTLSLKLLLILYSFIKLVEQIGKD